MGTALQRKGCSQRRRTSEKDNYCAHGRTFSSRIPRAELSFLKELRAVSTKVLASLAREDKRAQFDWTKIPQITRAGAEVYEAELL